jgi:glycosyltransferase involved in cell wall biosynthesis
LTQRSFRELFQRIRDLARDATLESHGEPTSESSVEWFLWAGGSRQDTEPELARTLADLRLSCRKDQVAFLLDGSETRRWEVVAAHLPEFPNRRVITLPRPTDLPALLYDLALRDSNAKWAAFLWPGCSLERERLVALANGTDEADLVYGGFSTSARPFLERARGGWVLGDSGTSHEPAEILHPVQLGWLQMADCVPMNGCLLSVPFAKRTGVFDANPLLRRFFWWHATRQIASAGRLTFVPTDLPVARWNWDTFPFPVSPDVPTDLSVRFLSCPRTAGRSPQTSAAEVEAFENDLPESERRLLTSALEAWEERLDVGAPPPPVAARGPVRRSTGAPFPLRVTVLGGPYEPHHNQIYFFNFFERISGEGYVSWKTLLYQTCQPADLESSDLVIFCRPRYPGCEVLIEACARSGIATLAMIDDNWIAAGRDYSRYAPLFTPGKPAFETFRRSITAADATLVFNELLEEDLRPMARQLVRLPPNVNTRLFRPDGGARRPAGFLAGYAGSPRVDNVAFRALALLAHRYPDVRLLVMAHERPPEWNEVDERVVFVPFCVDYRRYARTLATLAPDVMVAPLDGTRFSASKCPNKFLDLSAASTAGIYSNTKPYTDYVEPGLTGLLVNDTVEAWLDALEELYENPGKRLEIARRAREQVVARFDTAVVLPQLLDLLRTLANSKSSEMVSPKVRR